tara:strand:- start:456 stop:872 length:417 start_codon:yes stop_codon:yes gene_type:complete
MGVRKKNTSDLLKSAKKNKAFATLKKCPTSPRKMRLIADNIRGMNVNKALNVLKNNPKEVALRMKKLLLSCMANWQAKNEGKRVEDVNLCITEIFVDSARMLKRVQPAPQGRAHRIRKRSNHVTMVINELNSNMAKEK